MNQELSANTTLSHYRIISRLGAGGMGEVWLAYDGRLKRKVALKLLPAELTAEAGRVRRFEQEAQAASALNHPNIVTVYDIGENDAGLFIVMELVAGRTLRDVIAEDSSLETVLTIGPQMAKALAAAHSAGITHRDIKPDNIMVREDGYVKVLDFGLARLLPTTSGEEAATLAQQTTPGMIMGTIAYMSPEQASGQSASPPSDIFALGIVLYEMAAGRHPFQADTLVGYLHAITLQTPQPPSRLNPGIPAALDELIMRMLEKVVSQRPTAIEVAEALQEIERRGDMSKPQSGEGETRLMPIIHTGATRVAEGFWVAVLPFKWRGANAELESLAEGLSEDIVTGLSRFSYLRVIARSSTLRFTGETSDVRAIGKELGARYVMEGSLRQAGSMLRVAVQLVDASTGAHLWAENYDRTFSPEDIFALQDDLVPRIVSTVADWYGVLPHSMSEAVRLKAPDQLSPYEAVLRSFGYFERIAPEEHAAVRAGLERAVEQSPGNADGWAMLSMLYGEEHRFGFNMLPDPLGRALQAARRAVDAAHANHFAWLALAQALFFRMEFAAFRDAAERAIALNPMDGSTLEYLAHLIAFAGDWERGCDIAEQAQQLNPNHPGWYWTIHFLNAYRKGDYHSAHPYLLKTLMRGGGAQAMEQTLHAALCGQLGEQEAAAQALRTALSLQPDLARTVREQFGKWYLPELVEQLMDGLRKAGLGIVDEQGMATPSPMTDVTVTRATAGSGGRPAIAVLPFANMSADSDQEYFCDGLAEELLNALAKIDELKVAARTSAFSFKGKNAEAREIGKTLNVNTVLEGSVRKSGNRIRITVQLVNAADGYHLWSERYDREMQDIFDVQDEITLAVVDALKLKLLGAKKAEIFERKPNSAEALDLYLKGRFHFQQHTPEGFEKAVEYFLEAIDEDPNYALAFAGLSSVLIFRWFFGFVSADEVIPNAKNAALRALELNGNLDEAHIALAHVYMFYEWNLEKAGQEYRKAILLNPKNAYARYQYGLCLAVMEKPQQAILEAEKAIELEPLSVFANFQVAAIYFHIGLYEETIRYGQRMIEMAPGFYGGYLIKGAALLAQGEFVEAIRALEKSLTLDKEQDITKSFLGQAFGLTGNKTRALELIKELQDERRKRCVNAFYIARIYSSLRDAEETFEWMEKACEERNGELVYLKLYADQGHGNIWGQEICSDKRFQDFLRRLGFSTTETDQTDKAQKVMPLPIIDGKQTGDTLTAPATLRHTVGRERERNELRAAFNTANDGRGSMLCVAGEPGIGKTTLVEDFLAGLAAGNQSTIARGRCSERLAGTEAYLPLLEALESLLQSDQSIAQTMKQLAPTWYAQVVPLSGESDEPARLLAEVKAASQERMKRELAAFLQEVARLRPLVIFFDDLHWADVSTIDLLSFLSSKFDVLKVLVVTTYRPSDMLLNKHPFLQIKPDLQAHGVCRELLLEFLTEAEIGEYLALEFPGHRFPNEFPKLIHAKTEGSPLFMADLVRYLRDRSVIAQSSGAWMLAQTLPDIERDLPESVRGMIERKIAQLGEEDRNLLTAASVQGYEFDSAVVAQVLNLEADEVEERLEKLERVFSFVKLVSEAEFPNQALTLKYRFVHVLYQHTLYGGLRLTRKTSLSAAVAQSLEGFYGKQSTNIANELAVLWEEAREYARAADNFLKAAGNATQINAHREATELARRGLETLQRLPESSECAQLELGLQLRLGLSLTTVHGWTSQEAGQCFTQAHKLCQQAGNDPRLFAALRGIWARHMMRGEYEAARPLADQLLQLAEQADDPVLLASACFGVGITIYLQGELRAAREYCERALALYDPTRHKAYLAFSTQDLGVQAGYILAYCLWNLGYPDHALKQVEEGLALAERLSHPGSLGGALYSFGAVCFWRGEWQASQRHAERALALSQENDLGDFLIWTTLLHDLAQGFCRQPEAKIDQVRQSLDVVRDKGLGFALPLWLARLAELSGLAGRIAAGLETTAEALARIERTGERYWEAEVWRIKGDLLLQTDKPSQSEAEDCYHKAIEVAQGQSAKSLELRATMSLARLWQHQVKIDEARQMLAEVYGWFTEGFDTADLKEAKALLDELS